MSTQPPYDAVLRDWHRITEEAMRLQSENERLQAENESLRKELAVTNPLFETLNDANDRLLAENAKLRELVRDMYDHAEFSIHYFGDIYGICDRMRELGVEV